MTLLITGSTYLPNPRIAGGGQVVSIFDPSLQNYFWNYQNNGDRLVQLRFYPAQ